MRKTAPAHKTKAKTAAPKKKKKPAKIRKVTARKSAEKKRATKAGRPSLKKTVKGKTSPKTGASRGKKPKKKITKKVVSPRKTAKKATKKIKKGIVPIHREAPVTPPLIKIPAILQELQISETNRIVLLARDPNWIFTYWEISNKTITTLRKRLPHSHIALRVYDITGSTIEKPNKFFDIDVYERTGNWHIEVNQPDREFIVDAGLISPEGTFLTIARSNKILTPRDIVDELTMEGWRTRKLYRTAYDIDMEKSRVSS